MSKFYSKSTKGFYDTDVNAVIPADAVSVTDADYQALFTAQSKGMIIQPDLSGNPVAVTASVVPQPLASQAQWALTKSDTTILRCYSASVPVPTEWQSYRSALRAIANGTDTASTSIPSAPAYPAGT